MNVSYQKIKIRDASLDDARKLLLWWNNGKVMEHAGFPFGLETTEEKIKQSLEKNDNNYRHIIEYNNKEIGEMNYIVLDNNVCDIGIKICEFSYQNNRRSRRYNGCGRLQKSFRHQKDRSCDRLKGMPYPLPQSRSYR